MWTNWSKELHTKQATVRDGGAGSRRGMQHDPGAVLDHRLAFIVASTTRLCVWASADRPYHLVPRGGQQPRFHLLFIGMVCTALNSSKQPHSSRVFCGGITMQSGFTRIFIARPYASPARGNQSPDRGR